MAGRKYDGADGRRETAPVDVLLADGSIATIRPLDAGDQTAVTALFGDSSEGSLYFRFFTLGRLAPTRYVAHLFENFAATRSLVVELHGEIVGIADAEMCTPEEAEVAFLVADQVHGLGVGTLLLEHLAAMARRSGIRWFTAEVLATNASMLRVFHDAGFKVERKAEAGVVLLHMSTEADLGALAAADIREVIAESRSLKPLLAPRNVAVIGASRKPGGVGRALLDSIRNGAFKGEVFAVHPQADAIDGFPTYGSLSDVPADLDLAVIAVPAQQVMATLRDAADARIRAVVVVSSGFGEFSENGRRAQRELVAFARRHNIRIVGPNCLGVICNDPAVRLNATFGGEAPPSGGIAVASQSGGVGIAILEAATQANLGINSFISLGNKADVSGNDLIEAWIDDPGVTVATLYLESFGNPLKFSRLARRFSERKPLLAIVGGRSAGGQRAGVSHTAAAAGPAVAIDALFAQAGVIGCRSLDELIDTAQLLDSGVLPEGSRVGIVSNAGGLGVLAADAAADRALLVPELSPLMRDRIARHVSGTVGISNPIDLGPGISPDGLRACVEELLESDEIDSLIVIIAHTSLRDSATLLDSIRQTVEESEKPVLIVRPRAIRVSSAHDDPSAFESTERALTALSNARRYGEWRSASRQQVQGSASQVIDEARDLVRNLLDQHGDGAFWLPIVESQELLGLYGLNAPEGVVATTFRDVKVAATSVGFPVTIKSADPTFVHRTEKRLVVTGLRTVSDLHDGVEELRTRADLKSLSVLVQHHEGQGLEVALGIVRDPLFGPLLMIAAGGTATDILSDRAFVMPPLDKSDALHALKSLRIWPLLNGHRGAEPTDVESLIKLIETLGNFARELPEVCEVDFNPVIVTPSGVHCVDVKIRVAPEAPGHDLDDLRSLGATR